MPVYEYVCRGCEHRFDLLLPHSRADAPGPCPSCANGDVRRAFSRIGVALNAWGFGGTDSMVPDRPTRGDFKTVKETAERMGDGG